MRRLVVTAAALALAAPPLFAQQSGISEPCSDPRIPQDAQATCVTVAQAVESAQPQIGILLAAGNPTLGTASTGGIRLGVLPRVSATLKGNVVFVRLPGILAENAGGAAQRLNEAVGLPVPALSGTLSVGVYPGVSLAPTVGGFGAVDLLASATWLPLQALGAEGFEGEAPDFTYGFGARLGILRESFTTPGVSVSLMRREMGDLAYGDVCPSPAPLEVSESRPEYELRGGVCTGGGDPGEFRVDLTNWSGRAAVSKRLLGVGLAAGVGYDRFESDAGFGLRTRCPAGVGSSRCFVRASGLELDNDRWSGFVDASFTLLLASFGVELGWLQGTEPLPRFENLKSEFDPRSGTFFGSVGFRLAL
jgi:hypothetical protein